MSVFNWTPDFGASKNVKPSVRPVQFGDGYEQRIARGINTVPKNWSVKFENRDDAEATAIDAFLEARAGLEAFDWTPPGAPAALKYVCREWNKATVKHNLNTVTAVFTQVFEP